MERQEYPDCSNAETRPQLRKAGQPGPVLDVLRRRVSREECWAHKVDQARDEEAAHPAGSP